MFKKSALLFLAVFLALTPIISAQMISNTAGSPANGAQYCGTKTANYVFTPIIETAAEKINCSINVGGVITLNTTTVVNATANTITYSAPNWGSYAWTATCSNATAVVTTASRQVNFVLQPCNMNTSEGIGGSVMNGLKGGSQFVAQVVDQSLDESNGVVEVGALVIIIVVLGFGLQQARKAKQHGSSLM